MKDKILLTGATGFIGKRFVEMNHERFDIRTVSFQNVDCACGIDFYEITAVVHLAGIAHQMTKIDDQIYFDINHKKTLELAREAKALGVQHFVFASTVKVYGEETADAPLDEHSPTLPNDAYGKSKLAAEQDLLKLADEKFTVSIVRLPLVYGPRVKGNVLRLLQLFSKNYPMLPLGGIENQRSMVFVDNLVELFNQILKRKMGGVFIAGDREPISTSRLNELIIKYLTSRTRLVAMPKILISFLNFLKPALVRRLFGSFVIDNRSTNERLDFVPPFSAEDGVRGMCAWFLKSKNGANFGQV